MSHPSRARTAFLPAVVGLVLVTAACGGSHSGTAGLTTTTTVRLAAAVRSPRCTPPDLPAGFTLDAARSGPIQPGQYSAAGDVQAAMIYDQYRAGYRTVYTNLHPAAGGDSNLVVECVAMEFGSPADAVRFLGSYKDLRKQAGSLAQAVTAPASAGAGTVEYLEHGQSFAGYQIASTDVLEVAGQSGDRVTTVAVAGPSPSADLAVALLRKVEAS
ncbi:MAG: hypothetical protein JO148_12270 [Acidimicrobiia bacterium]|nr:hypothetical protein [Acidimicrobiia bacterium]